MSLLDLAKNNEAFQQLKESVRNSIEAQLRDPNSLPSKRWAAAIRAGISAKLYYEEVILANANRIAAKKFSEKDYEKAERKVQQTITAVQTAREDKRPEPKKTQREEEIRKLQSELVAVQKEIAQTKVQIQQIEQKQAKLVAPAANILARELDKSAAPGVAQFSSQQNRAASVAITKGLILGEEPETILKNTAEAVNSKPGSQRASAVQGEKGYVANARLLLATITLKKDGEILTMVSVLKQTTAEPLAALKAQQQAAENKLSKAQAKQTALQEELTTKRIASRFSETAEAEGFEVVDVQITPTSIKPFIKSVERNGVAGANTGSTTPERKLPTPLNINGPQPSGKSVNEDEDKQAQKARVLPKPAPGGSTTTRS